jgi:hypothetical protein
VDQTTFNDAPGNVPRPITSGVTNFNFDSASPFEKGAKYLVIKSTVSAASPAAKRWTNVFTTSTTATLRTWADSTRDPAATDRIIVVRNNLNPPPTRELMTNGSLTPTYATTFSNYRALLPGTLRDGDTFQIYGIDAVSGTDMRMPFNRADYFISRPSTNMPSECAPKTGVLYKAIVAQSNGAPTNIPLLDCVADLQVVYGLDTNGRTDVEGASINLHTAIPPATAAEIRTQLKEIRVYVLAQDGKKDNSYTYPSSTIMVGESFDGGATVAGRNFNLATLIGADYQRYRWKVYTIVIRPKNLLL